MSKLCTLGVDIGSTTSKCVLLCNGEVLASSLVTAGTGTSGPMQAYEQVLQTAAVSKEQIAFTVVTGYGRNTFAYADEQVSEISCHARGVSHVFPAARTIIDIGGQDAKVISLNENSKIMNFAMNDKCAAGTGRFLDVMAQVLQLSVGELEGKAKEATIPAKISSTCTVFAESEVISQLAAGEEIANIVSGICASVAARVAALAKRVGIREAVCMSGGVAKNGAVREALAGCLGVPVHHLPMAQLMGALGAALYAQDKLNK